MRRVICSSHVNVDTQMLEKWRYRPINTHTHSIRATLFSQALTATRGDSILKRQRSPTFWTPGVGFMEDNASTQRSWGDGVRMAEARYIYRALGHYYYDSSCTSDPRRWRPPVPRRGVSTEESGLCLWSGVTCRWPRHSASPHSGFLTRGRKPLSLSPAVSGTTRASCTQQVVRSVCRKPSSRANQKT